MKIAAWVLVVLAVLALTGYVGLKIRPAPFAAYQGKSAPLQTVALRQGLPAPVERFFRTTIGERVPVITSAIYSGTADLTVGGIRFPARWRFTHQPGQAYRHYIEATVFGRPLMKVNEHYLDGSARLDLPTGVVENDAKTDSAANLALWGEAINLPSLWVNDPRARWEAIDDTHARLVIPAGAEEDSFTVTFDAQTGLIDKMEAMRWKGTDSAGKTLWILRPLAWERFEGILMPSESSVTWQDDPGPWLVMTLREMVYNTDVSAYIKADGP